MNLTQRSRPASEVVIEAICLEAKLPQDGFRPDEMLADYGIESVMSVAIVRRLEETYGELPKTLLFEYPTARQLIEYMEAEYPGSAPPPVAVWITRPLASM